MTGETNAEAWVATELSQQEGASETDAEALADAAALVDNDRGNALLSGGTAPSNVAVPCHSRWTRRVGTSRRTPGHRPPRVTSRKTNQTRLRTGRRQWRRPATVRTELRPRTQFRGSKRGCRRRVQRPSEVLRRGRLNCARGPNQPRWTGRYSEGSGQGYDRDRRRLTPSVSSRIRNRNTNRRGSTMGRTVFLFWFLNQFYCGKNRS